MSGEDEREPSGMKSRFSAYYISDDHYERGHDFDNVRYALENCFSHPGLLAEAIEEGLALNSMFGAVEADNGAGSACRGCEIEERSFYRYFFRLLAGVLEHIEGRRHFIEDYLATGGAILFTVRLYGGGNIGDMLPPETLMRMAKLEVRLRIEVVPVWPGG